MKGSAKAMASALAAVNAAAAAGRYDTSGQHPSITSGSGSLRETYRGWRTDVP